MLLPKYFCILVKIPTFKFPPMQLLYSRLIAINTIYIAFTSTVSFNCSFSPFSGVSWPMYFLRLCSVADCVSKACPIWLKNNPHTAQHISESDYKVLWLSCVVLYF